MTRNIDRTAAQAKLEARIARMRARIDTSRRDNDAARDAIRRAQEASVAGGCQLLHRGVQTLALMRHAISSQARAGGGLTHRQAP